jgi:hypothetical protein
MRGNYYLLFVIDPKIPLFGKEGEGRFSDNFIFRKIPPNLPFPKGGILFSCPFVSRRLVLIPAKAGIQKRQTIWIPHQVRNDRLIHK